MEPEASQSEYLRNSALEYWAIRPAPKAWFSLAFQATTGSMSMLVRLSLLMLWRSTESFFVFGGRTEGDVHAQAQSYVVIDFICAVEVRSDGGFGDLPLFEPETSPP